MDKKELKVELEQLLPEILPLFQNFISDQRVNHYIMVKKDRGYYVGKLRLVEVNALCQIEITKQYYIFPQSDDLDNKITIEIYWFDGADDITYSSHYFADVTNSSAVAKTKILLDAAQALAIQYHEARRKEKGE